jgi:hypothetical protein
MSEHNHQGYAVTLAGALMVVETITERMGISYCNGYDAVSKEPIHSNNVRWLSPKMSDYLDKHFGLE